MSHIVTDTAPPTVFCDTETDGLHPDRKPWEIAIIRRDYTDDQGTQNALSIFVEIDLSTADPMGLRVGRFYERHPLGRWIAQTNGEGERPRPDDSIGNYVTRKKAAELVACWTYGADPLVGAVPNFDTETLSPLLRENGLIPAWHHHIVDVETLAIGYLRGQGRPAPKRPWKSDDLLESIGVPPIPEDRRHTAYGDTCWVMAAYDLVMGGD
jgi:hypothetical protein